MKREEAIALIEKYISNQIRLLMRLGMVAKAERLKQALQIIREV